MGASGPTEISALQIGPLNTRSDQKQRKTIPSARMESVINFHRKAEYASAPRRESMERVYESKSGKYSQIGFLEGKLIHSVLLYHI